MPSAVIVRARLPAGLESLRRRQLADAAAGVPAHLTMLYPFVEPGALTPGVRAMVAAVAGHHRPFDYELRGPARFPDTIYVAVSPIVPFVRLQRDLQAAFPDFPIYGRGASFRFVPHVSIAEQPFADDDEVTRNTAWRALPRPGRATALDVIATGADARWRLVWRIALGAAPTTRADRMRP